MILSDKSMINMAKRAYKIPALVALADAILAIFLAIWEAFLNLPLEQTLALGGKNVAVGNTTLMNLLA